MPKKQLHFSEHEISSYLNMLTKSTEITAMLKYDVCFRLADNYLIALIFIYFKRAHLKPAEFSYIYFFAALLLAHAMVEEDDDVVEKIIMFALPEPHDSTLRMQLNTVKFALFESMHFRGYVSRSTCDKVISSVPHFLWSRQRDAIHGGTSRPHMELTESDATLSLADWYTRSCNKCRSTPFMYQKYHNCM